MNKPSQLTQSLIGDRRPIRKVLEDQKALDTGADSGIGPALALAFGQAGADVVVNYVAGDEARSR